MGPKSKNISIKSRPDSRNYSTKNTKQKTYFNSCITIFRN